MGVLSRVPRSPHLGPFRNAAHVQVMRGKGCDPGRTGSIRSPDLPPLWGRERLIDVANRTHRPPDWRLFAIEYLDPAMSPRRGPPPMVQRFFRATSAQDQAVFEAAVSALHARTTADGRIPGIPEDRIPSCGRSDDRLPRYGYTRYCELFNSRQLLHLSVVGQAVAALGGEEREALALAFSNHLTTNCMMTSYAFGWRRAVPLFSVRAFRHIPRPVELNPWLVRDQRLSSLPPRYASCQYTHDQAKDSVVGGR